MAKRGRSRDRMVDGAIALFRERGVAGTALSDVVDRTDTPRGSVYHNFPEGKAQLAEEATDQAGRIMGRMIGAVVAADGPAAAVTAFIDYFRGDLPESDYTAGCPVAAGAMSGADTPGARRRAGEAFIEWEATLASAFWQQGLEIKDAEHTATLAIAAIEGALVMARAQRSTRPLDRVEAFMLREIQTLFPATEK